MPITRRTSLATRNSTTSSGRRWPRAILTIRRVRCSSTTIRGCWRPLGRTGSSRCCASRNRTRKRRNVRPCHFRHWTTSRRSCRFDDHAFGSARQVAVGGALLQNPLAGKDRHRCWTRAAERDSGQGGEGCEVRRHAGYQARTGEFFGARRSLVGTTRRRGGGGRSVPGDRGIHSEARAGSGAAAGGICGVATALRSAVEAGPTAN